jgi:predicted enzyme related to lactoylglutathione lyase
MRYIRFAAAMMLAFVPALAPAQTTTTNSTTVQDNQATKKPLTRVTGIGGIFIKAKDPAMLRAWYKQHLGIDVKPWGGTAFRWADASGQPTAGSTAWSIGDGKYFAPSTSTYMVNYRVADLRALLAALRAEGCEVLEKTEESEFGKFGWVMDPEGNKIELWEPPAGK